jgi:hypothetical protein
MIKCNCCGDVADVVTVDLGIGRYEYWGATYNDINEQDVTDCCWADWEEVFEDELVA